MKKFITEISKKWLRKYFLSMADAPIQKGIITGVILFTTLLILIMIFFFNSEWIALNLSGIALTISAYVTIFLSAINYIVAKLLITAFTRFDKRIIVIHDKDKVKKYAKPIWGKHPYSIIHLPNWELPFTKRVNSIEIETKIRVNRLISNLKFKLYFSFSGELNENELSTLVKSRANYHLVHHVSFAECIKTLFENHNFQTGNNDVIEIIISDWLDSTKDRTDLVEKINGIISFPNDLFDNMKIEVLVENVEIQLACVLN